MVQVGSYGKNTLITFITAVLNLVLGIFVSVIIARALGPEGKGIYTVTTLFSYLIVTFGSFGLPSAVAFYVAKQSYARQELLGNTVLVGLITGALGMMAGLITTILFGQHIFPGISRRYLLLALLIIPGNMLLIHLQYMLLGAQHIEGYNLAAVVQSFLSLVLTMLFLWIFRMGVTGALMAIVLSWTFGSIFTFTLTIRISNGIKLQINSSYLKNVLGYGLKIHISNILRFLALRVNLFLINSFLNPTAAGFYSISVGLTEKLWLISQAAATVLFPKIAMEEDEVKKKEFTPIVARTVLWIMILTALIIFLLSQWLISFLYSPIFLPAVASLKILLLATVAAGLSQILGNDIAGRGRPILNVYANIVGFISVVVLSVLWIPKYGIDGAAWASAASYILNLTVTILLYTRISGNSLRAIILPKRTDWILYRKMGQTLWQWAGKMLRATTAIGKEGFRKMYVQADKGTKFRILHVIDTLGIGGAENYVVNLANTLDKRKFEVWIAYTDGSIQGIDGEALIRRLDRSVKLVKWSPKKIGSLRSLRYLPYNIYHIVTLYKIIQQYDIDLVHTHLPFSALRAWIAAKIAGVPVIHNHMTIITPERRTEWLLVKYKILAKVVNRLVDKYIAFSHFFMQDLKTKLGVDNDKIELIYIAVDLAPNISLPKNRHLKAKFHLDDQTPVVGVVARLYPEKGVNKVLSAFPHVIKEIPDARLLIIGDGPLRGQLEEMTKALGISDNVIFAGVRHDVPELLKIIDVYVQTTDRPNLGLSVLEAMGAAKPLIIIAQNDEEREMAKETVIDKVNGFIVPNVPEEIASKIIWLLKNKEEANKMGQESRKLAEERFDLKKHVSQIEALYESMIKFKAR